MKLYRLVIRQQGRLLGHFDTELPDALDALREISSRLPTSEGFQLEVLEARDEKRLLESTSSGIRVLSREPVFRHLDLKALWAGESADE